MLIIITNSDYVHHKCKQILRDSNPSGGIWVVDELKQFVEEYPDFVVDYQLFSKAGVICFQTWWMLSQCIQDFMHMDNFNLNGIVMDGAHKFWDRQNHVLQISSVYSVILSQWIPILLSYMDGQTTNHFHFHFLVLFWGIIEVAKYWGLENLKEHLTTICAVISLKSNQLTLM